MFCERQIDFRHSVADIVDTLASSAMPALVSIANNLVELGRAEDPWAAFAQRRAITLALRRLDEARAELDGFLVGESISFLPETKSCQT